jgi:hypothetical protein
MEKIVLSPHQHDEIVRREALRLLRDGFDVQARLGGSFKRPASVHGYRPDIFAVKDAKQVIVEVVKGSIDWPKTSALERYSQEHPEIEVRIIPPKGAWPTNNAQAAEPRQRFLIGVAKLLGISPTKESILYGALICPTWLLNEIIDNIVKGDGTISLDLTAFNRIMVNCRRPLASEHFFDWVFSGVSTVDAFEHAVDRYRVCAMWVFGNFKFAYRAFAACSQAELQALKAACAERDAKPFEARTEFNEIANIPEEDLHLLGYLSSAVIEPLLYLESLADISDDQQDFSALLAGIPPDLRGRLSQALNGRDCTDARRLAATLRDESSALLIRQEKARESGRKNTLRYLSLPFVDVYVATSMREAPDFVSQHRFTESVFGNDFVKDLKLRFFDPTLSYEDDRATKGLIECLMLQRASVTLYNAGTTDTMGKDSELAATLAQGKPVIVYVPEGAAFDRRADTFRLDHPLGLQIDHDTGVAHGILVARTPEHCAKLIRGVLLNSLDLHILHEGGLYMLEERTTGSVVRVVTDNALLTHTFWTYFRHHQDKDSRPLQRL